MRCAITVVVASVYYYAAVKFWTDVVTGNPYVGIVAAAILLGIAGALVNVRFWCFLLATSIGTYFGALPGWHAGPTAPSVWLLPLMWFPLFVPVVLMSVGAWAISRQVARRSV